MKIFLRRCLYLLSGREHKWLFLLRFIVSVPLVKLRVFQNLHKKTRILFYFQITCVVLHVPGFRQRWPGNVDQHIPHCAEHFKLQSWASSSSCALLPVWFVFGAETARGSFARAPASPHPISASACLGLLCVHWFSCSRLKENPSCSHLWTKYIGAQAHSHGAAFGAVRPNFCSAQENFFQTYNKNQNLSP